MSPSGVRVVPIWGEFLADMSPSGAARAPKRGAIVPAWGDWALGTLLTRLSPPQKRSSVTLRSNMSHTMIARWGHFEQNPVHAQIIAD
jgi:hypothetical protein